MAKLMPAKEAAHFKTYLENNIFHQKLDYFQQFRGGNSSYCFHLQAGAEKYVAKILLGAYITDDVHVFLEKQIARHPVLRGIKMDKIFTYGTHTATIQKNYGNVLPRRKFSPEMLTEIFEEYAQIMHSCTPYVSGCAQPASIPYRELSEKVAAQKNLHSRFIAYFLQKISPESLIYHPQKLRVIHGDFNNNQVLLQEGKLSAFIDWDSVRTGYPAEDYWEFVYFNLRRLYNPFSLKFWCHQLLHAINTATSTPKDEWLYAINSNLFTQLNRLQEKFKLKYIWKFLWLYAISKCALKYLEETTTPAE